MFTVKHIGPDGNESMVECHRFVRERRSDGFTQFLAYPEKPLPGEYIATWCGDESVRYGPELPGTYQQIYVMNRFGSTVASYSFGQPDFSRTAGAEQADPEKLAA